MAGNEGNLLIDELAQENSDNINSTRTSDSYDQISVMITWVLFVCIIIFISFFYT